MPFIKRLKQDYKRFNSADIITGVYALHHNMVDVFDTPESQLVLEAIRRSTVDLDDNASIHEIAKYIQKYDEEQLLGIINNIKGIYHEIRFVYEENNDYDEIMAEMFEDTNHPNSDVILINTETGQREYVQLKATDDVEYVKEAIDNNPDIRVISTEELAEKMGIDTSNMSNKELREEVEVVIEDLSDEKDLLDYIPAATFWSTTFAIFPIIQKYFKKEISKKECTASIAKITGYKAARVICLLVLLSFPITAIPTSTYLIMKYTTMIVKTFQSNKA